MPQELGLPVYLGKDTEAGTKVVEAGEYCGHTMSAKYNNRQHNFFEVGGEGRHVILNGGQLDWREDQGTLEVGKLYDVVFDGMKEIEKGQWSGSNAKQYKLAVYSASETKDLLKKSGSELKGGSVKADSPVEEEPVEEKAADASESLDDLE